MNTAHVTSVVNGRQIAADVPVRQTLAEFLRDELGLTGTKVSCEMQVCGVCTVLVDGEPVSSCTYLAVDVDGRAITTVEGLASRGELSDLQSAFLESFAFQCGFCTPGFVVMASALLDTNPHPDEDEIAEYLEGNICRCTGYRPIIEAIAKSGTKESGT